MRALVYCHPEKYEGHWAHEQISKLLEGASDVTFETLDNKPGSKADIVADGFRNSFLRDPRYEGRYDYVFLPDCGGPFAHLGTPNTDPYIAELLSKVSHLLKPNGMMATAKLADHDAVGQALWRLDNRLVSEVRSVLDNTYLVTRKYREPVELDIEPPGERVKVLVFAPHSGTLRITPEDWMKAQYHDGIYSDSSPMKREVALMNNAGHFSTFPDRDITKHHDFDEMAREVPDLTDADVAWVGCPNDSVSGFSAEYTDAYAGAYDHIFVNCSSDLTALTPERIVSAARMLKPGGHMLVSDTRKTDKFLQSDEGADAIMQASDGDLLAQVHVRLDGRPAMRVVRDMSGGGRQVSLLAPLVMAGITLVMSLMPR